MAHAISIMHPSKLVPIKPAEGCNHWQQFCCSTRLTRTRLAFGDIAFIALHFDRNIPGEFNQQKSIVEITTTAIAAATWKNRKKNKIKKRNEILDDWKLRRSNHYYYCSNALSGSRKLNSHMAWISLFASAYGVHSAQMHHPVAH